MFVLALSLRVRESGDIDSGAIDRRVAALHRAVREYQPMFAHAPVIGAFDYRTNLVFHDRGTCDEFIGAAHSAVDTMDDTEMVHRVYDGDVADSIERPVFIISCPRSGSTLLFETLAKAPDTWTIGAENFHIVDRIPEIHWNRRQPATDALAVADATPSVTRALRIGFGSGQRDRDGTFLFSHVGVRRSEHPVFIEKTPRNCLRIEFLKAVFPQARFVFLTRDPRAVISSMMTLWLDCERRRAWNKVLPGWGAGECWEPERWLGLLPPGWEALDTTRLIDVIAFKWRAAHESMLAAARRLARADWIALAFEQLIAERAPTVRKLCEFAGIGFDERVQTLVDAPLPHSASTRTPPHPDKWKRHTQALAQVEREIDAVRTTMLSVFGFAP